MPDFTEEDHERARRAGEYAMKNLKDLPPAEPKRKSWLERLAESADKPRLKQHKFPTLDVRVAGDSVYQYGGWGETRLGSLAGAHAELTDGTRPHRVAAGAALATVSLGAGALVALTRKHKASAFVVFAEGTVHERKLTGKSMISGAQSEVVRFNALAGAADETKGR